VVAATNSSNMMVGALGLGGSGRDSCLVAGCQSPARSVRGRADPAGGIDGGCGGMASPGGSPGRREWLAGGPGDQHHLGNNSQQSKGKPKSPRPPILKAVLQRRRFRGDGVKRP